MTTEQAIKTERNKLLVVTVMEPKPVGDKGAIKYSAKVKAGEKEFILQTFSKIFGEYFKPGETLDAEYSVTTRENANDPEHPWIDRKVTQIFVDGKAVGGDKTGRQWRASEDSPEKRASIEAQSAVQAVVQLRISDKLKDDNPIYLAALHWCTIKLGQPAKEALFFTPVTPTATPTPSQPPAAKTGAVPTKGWARPGTLPETVASVDAAQKIAEQCGMDRDSFTGSLGSSGLTLKSPPDKVWEVIKPLLAA